MDNDQRTYSEEEYIDFGKYFKRLLVHWKSILLWAIIAFLIGCAYALCMPRKYTVVSKLAPELSSTATNRLTTMASLVGLSSNVLGTTDAVYPMVYPDLVKSPAFIADLFDVPVSFRDKKAGMVETTLYDYLLNYRKQSFVGVILSFPTKAAGWLKGLFRKEEESGSSSAVDPFHFTRQQGAVATFLSKCISAEIDKKTLVVTVAVRFSDPGICAQLCRSVNETLKEYVTGYRTGKALRDCEYYEKMFEAARDEYYSAQKDYSQYMDSHQGLAMRSFMIESERLKNEVNLKYQLYNSTAQQLQNAKAKVQLETPVFAEIIPPSVPLKPSNSKKKTALAFAFIGLLAGAVYVLIKYREEE